MSHHDRHSGSDVN